jgi:hypothetical protein
MGEYAMEKNGNINMPLIRKLAERQTAEDLEACLSKTIEDGSSACVYGVATEEAVAVLAKATYIRKRMDREGISVRAAIRAIGAQIRHFTKTGTDRVF